MNKSLLIIAFIFLCINTSHGKMKVGESRLIEESGDPAVKSAGGSDLFVGISKSCSDEQSARNDAVLDARKQILGSLEIKISAEQTIDRLFIEDQTGIIESREQYDAKTLSVTKGILSVKPESFYIEKSERQVSKKEVEYEYKVWCLIRYSQAEHEKIVTAIVTSMLEAVEPLISRAETERQTGQIQDALRSVGQVRELISDMVDYPAIPVSYKTKITQINDRVEKLVGSIKLAVAVYERIEGERLYSPQFNPRLVEALTNANLISIQSTVDWSQVNPDALLADRSIQVSFAEQSGADLILVGVAEVLKINDSKANYNIYSARMQARLKMINTRTGTTLWETSLPDALIKEMGGFASTGQDAALNALSLKKMRNLSNSEDPFEILAENILANFNQ